MNCMVIIIWNVVITFAKARIITLNIVHMAAIYDIPAPKSCRGYLLALPFPSHVELNLLHIIIHLQQLTNVLYLIVSGFEIMHPLVFLLHSQWP